MTSARAVDSTMLKRLYDFNQSFPQDTPVAINLSKKRKVSHPEEWGGFVVRTMLQLLYIISTLCLLRYDEALGIIWEDIHLETWKDSFRLRLDLSVRKTHQNGGALACVFITRIWNSHI